MMGLGAAKHKVRGRNEHALPDSCNDGGRLLNAHPSCEYTLLVVGTLLGAWGSAFSPRLRAPVMRDGLAAATRQSLWPH